MGSILWTGVQVVIGFALFVLIPAGFLSAMLEDFIQKEAVRWIVCILLVLAAYTLLPLLLGYWELP